jgi:hypothetical protein
MSKCWLYLLFWILCLSCKKEYSLEKGQVSAGYLASDGVGNCGQITIKGRFTARETIPADSYAEVNVIVKRTGSFSIKTDTINGYSFSASGNFADTGSVNVKLNAHGTPAKQGIDDFMVVYDSSICQLSVTVNANSADPASFTLNGAPGKCMNASVSGVLVKGIATDTSNKVTIGVLVNTPGAYSISTNTANGYSFSGSGSFLNTGLQLVTLTATGTPAIEGVNSFSVTAGPSSCSFTDTVRIAVAPSNSDYFPLTDASFWVYNDDSNPGDSIVRTIVGAISTNGQQYKIMDEQVPFMGHHQLLFRKNIYDYLEYASGDEYTGTVVFSPQILKDMRFLSDNLATGDAWTSDEFKGPASFGQVILIRYDFKCIAANSTANINGNIFANVHKLRMLPQIRSESGPWGPTNELYELYYAKGVGLIYVKRVKGGYAEYERSLRRWQVN